LVCSETILNFKNAGTSILINKTQSTRIVKTPKNASITPLTMPPLDCFKIQCMHFFNFGSTHGFDYPIPLGLAHPPVAPTWPGDPLSCRHWPVVLLATRPHFSGSLIRPLISYFPHAGRQHQHPSPALIP
jgi:hypothetical protein